MAPSVDPVASKSLGSVAPPSLTPAHIVVESAHGVVEVEIRGRRFAGVLDAPGAIIAVGDALTLKLLCTADSPLPYVVENPEEFTALVIAIDDADKLGHSQLLSPGMGIDVELEGAVPALAPPTMDDTAVDPPVIVGASLDDALAGLLGDVLEPPASRGGDHDHDDDDDDGEDVITGSLRRMPLAELVQAMSFARKTATIRVRAPIGVGTIHLDAGEVIAAQLDGSPRLVVTRGAAAFARMLGCARGTFQVSFDAPAPERNVYGATQMLILDALRQIDEERRDEQPIELDESDLIFDLADDDEVPVRPALKPAARRRVTS